MAVFVKRVEKATLGDTFKEAIKVDKDMLILKSNHGSDPQKNKSTEKKFLLTKPSTKKKDQDATDMESLQRNIMKLSNEIVDIKMNTREGTSNTKKLILT
jgi:hypothetical protein